MRVDPTNHPQYTNILAVSAAVLTAADTLDKIVPRELAENAAINAVFAYGLANLEQPLPR